MNAGGSASRSGAVWALLLVSSAFYFGLVNEADNDLWGHVFAGREILRLREIPRIDTYSYTVHGLPWFNHEWLTHVIFGIGYEVLGYRGLVIIKLALVAVMVTVTLAGLARMPPARPGHGTTTRVSPWIWGGVGVLALAVLARGMAIRPQLFTYAALPLLLVFLDRAALLYARGREARCLWIWPLCFVLWVNLHGGFVLGIAVLGLFAAWQAIIAPRRRLQPALVLGACIAASAVNPYGVSLLVYLWDELSRPHPITEWQPVSFGEAEHSAFFVMLAALLLSLPWVRNWRHNGWRLVLALIIAFFALRQQRHTAVFALCAAVPLATNATALGDWLARRRVSLGAAAQRLLLLAVFGLALLQLGLTAARLRHEGLAIVFDAHEYPVQAVIAMRAGGAQGNLAVPLDWGAYVLWHLSPLVRPSIDGRFATLYPVDVVDKNFAFFTGGAGWRQLLDDYPTEAALVPRGTPAPISREPGWRAVYEDEVATLYVRADRLQAFAVQPVSGSARGIFP